MSKSTKSTANRNWVKQQFTDLLETNRYGRFDLSTVTVDDGEVLVNLRDSYWSAIVTATHSKVSKDWSVSINPTGFIGDRTVKEVQEFVGWMEDAAGVAVEIKDYLDGMYPEGF